MDTIVSLAKNYKTEKIGGYYIKTRFNEPVIEYFNSMGFHEIKSTNVKKKYELNIHEYKNNAESSLFNQQK